MDVLVDYKSLSDGKGDSSLNGSTGFCLLRGNIIIKLYFEPRYQFVDFSSYTSSQIAFPLCYLRDSRDSKAVVGEAMLYFNKKNITKSIDYNLSIDKLMTHYLKMIKEIKKFPHILMNDLVSPNILYDDLTGFSLIDTTNWFLLQSLDCSMSNIGNFNSELIELLFNLLDFYPRTIYDNNFRKNLLKYGLAGCELWKALQNVCYGDSCFLEILESFKIIDDKYSVGIKTINDVEKFVKILKKG